MRRQVINFLSELVTGKRGTALMRGQVINFLSEIDDRIHRMDTFCWYTALRFNADDFM